MSNMSQKAWSVASPSLCPPCCPKRLSTISVRFAASALAREVAPSLPTLLLWRSRETRAVFLVSAEARSATIASEMLHSPSLSSAQCVFFERASAIFGINSAPFIWRTALLVRSQTVSVGSLAERRSIAAVGVIPNFIDAMRGVLRGDGATRSGTKTSQMVTLPLVSAGLDPSVAAGLGELFKSEGYPMMKPMLGGGSGIAKTPDRLVNGGAIAMGHPLGATGGMVLGTLIDEIERRDLSTGLVNLCIGGGMGTSTIIERV